jgi:hypothetical protein
MKFLEENAEKNERQFEPEVVIQKMKRMKKTKKTKLMNYKNIEPLTNIYEEEVESPETKPSPPLREGLRGNPQQDGKAYFNDSDYVGGKDDIYEGKDGKAQTPGQKLEVLINYCYNTLRKIPLIIAYYMIKGIETADNGMNNAINSRMKRTQDKTSDVINDQKVIANLISWVFCIFLSMYAIWNWFYIVGYKTEDKEETVLPDVLNRQVVSRKGSFDPLFKLIDYFFNLSLFFPEKLQECINLGSSFVRSSFNPSFIFSFLFFTLIFLFYHSLSSIREFFIAIVRFDMKHTVLSTMYGILCFLLAISFFAPPININIESVEDAASLPGTILMQITEIVSSINPFKAILNLVIFVLHFLFIIFLGVPVAAFLCIAYIFSYTFFAVILLKGFNSHEILSLFWEKMPTYARSEKDKIKVETDCDTLTFWESMVNAFHYSFDIIYKYSFEIAFVYMLLFGFFDCLYKLKVKSVRITMTMIVVILILCLLLGCYHHFNYEQEIMLLETLKKEKEDLARVAADMSESKLGSSEMGLSGAINSISSIFGIKSVEDLNALDNVPNTPKIPDLSRLNVLNTTGVPKMPDLNNPVAAIDLNNPIGAVTAPELPKTPGSV